MATKTKTSKSAAAADYDDDNVDNQQQPSGTYYHIEHAASGRSKCKKCKDTIAKGELRIATSKFRIMAMCGVGDVREQWHHDFKNAYRSPLLIMHLHYFRFFIV